MTPLLEREPGHIEEFFGVPHGIRRTVPPSGPRASTSKLRALRPVALVGALVGGGHEGPLHSEPSSRELDWLREEDTTPIDFNRITEPPQGYEP